MKNKLLNLISVKSIITIVLTVVFGILSLRGTVTSEQFLMIFTTVIAFYFGSQHNRGKPE